MDPREWNDSRLDDLKRQVERIDDLLDRQGRTLIEHDALVHHLADQITTLARLGDRRSAQRSERAWAIYVLLTGVFVSSIASVAVQLLSH